MSHVPADHSMAVHRTLQRLWKYAGNKVSSGVQKRTAKAISGALRKMRHLTWDSMWLLTVGRILGNVARWGEKPQLGANVVRHAKVRGFNAGSAGLRLKCARLHPTERNFG